MKHFETLFYLFQHLFILFAGIALLGGIALIAESFSWYYLLLYIPLIIYGMGYKSKNIRR